jgi:hypothetical protein
MVAAHSAVSYYYGGIVYPHYQVMRLPDLQALVGQVWTGTARSPCRYEGVTTERTFENGYLEYSSLYNLMRGTGKRLWFLMDPLEDNPDRSMDDYQTNYEKTLIASLMFPGVDAYEVMPWPTRIYGRVPDQFATKIGTVVNMLSDIHNQKSSELDAGTQGIVTFVADSMAWQRGDPHPSNFEGFYGMTLPLFMKGIPVQVAQLERTSESHYLDPYKVMLLSYDLMKPMDPAYNTAIVRWVKSGGTLILFGGSDPYNGLSEWWKKAGFSSPQDHLLTQLGVKIGKSATVMPENRFKTILAETHHYRNAENRKLYTLDLSEYVSTNGRVFVKFEDAFKGDGWGPLVYSAKLRVDGQTVESFSPNSNAERKHIVQDDGSQFNGTARFADASTSWIYGFKAPAGKKVELIVDMGNQFHVSVAKGSAVSRELRKIAETALTVSHPEIDIPDSIEITTYGADAKSLYTYGKPGVSPIFEKKVGKGTVVFIGIAPRYFASSQAAGDLLRSIVAYGCSKAGASYRERGYIKIRRGKYVAARSFDKPVQLTGKFVDVLDPGIGFAANPTVPVGRWAVMADVSQLVADSKPRLLISSSRVEASRETASSTALYLTGPLKTKGITRISTAGKHAKSVEAFTTDGKLAPTVLKSEAGTLAVMYDDSPEGVVLRITWE